MTRFRKLTPAERTAATAALTGFAIAVSVNVLSVSFGGEILPLWLDALLWALFGAGVYKSATKAKGVAIAR